MTKRPSTTSLAAAALLLTGCGLANPQAVTTPQQPGPGASGVRTPSAVLDAQPDGPVRVAVDYTLTQATWSADSYVAQRAKLAQLATGPALAQLEPRDGAPPAAVAAKLDAARSSSHASLLGTDGPSRRDEVVVAYKVQATGSGRSTARIDYQVAHVTVTRNSGRWRVSRFAIAP
jgi:hypothetical protein